MRRFSSGVLGLTFALATPAWAGPAEESTTPARIDEPPAKTTARALAIEGIDAIEAGDCDRGAPLVERAESLFHAVVHLQYLARCHRAAGRLVIAAELLQRVATEVAPEDATPAAHVAVEEARRELPELLSRLPRTTLIASGNYDDLSIVLDGAVRGPEIWSGAQLLDPGTHTIAVTAPGYEPWSHRFSLEEGESVTLTVTLTPLATPTPATTPAAARQAPAPARLPPPPSSNDVPSRPPGDAVRTAGWILAGTGAAALVAAVVTLIDRNDRRDSLLARCPDGACPPGTEGEIRAVEDLTVATNVLFAAGGTVLGTGVALILLGGAGDTEDDSALAPTGGQLRWQGTF